MTDSRSYTHDEIADLFDLEPWQRELLVLWIERDKIAKAEKDSNRAWAEAEYERICRWLETELKGK